MISIRADSDVIGTLIDSDLKNHIEKIRVPLEGVCVASLMQLYIMKLPTESVLRLFDFLFLEGSAVMIFLELFLFKRTKDTLLKCTGIVEFSAALAKTESHMFSADEMVQGILEQMRLCGGMKRIRKLQLEAVANLERNDLQILHDELSSEIAHLPESNLNDDDSSSDASSVSSSRRSSTSRQRYMSDVDFESLNNTFNQVAATRVKSKRRVSITTEQRLSLEMQCKDYRNLSFPVRRSVYFTTLCSLSHFRFFPFS